MLRHRTTNYYYTPHVLVNLSLHETLNYKPLSKSLALHDHTNPHFNTTLMYMLRHRTTNYYSTPLVLVHLTLYLNYKPLSKSMSSHYTTTYIRVVCVNLYATQSTKPPVLVHLSPPGSKHNTTPPLILNRTLLVG